MIIVAILKHVAGKSADYGAALDYLKYEHDEVLKKPLLDANGNWVLRRDILLEGINCEPELFDVECEMLNLLEGKSQSGRFAFPVCQQNYTAGVFGTMARSSNGI